MSGARIDRPFFLGTGDDATFATFHAPEGDAGSGIGVLLCPPFGVEDQMSFRARRVWAHHLAAEGHAALRIDLPGTGDSAAGPRTPHRVAAWIEGVRTAVAWLRTAGGCERVVLVGIGLGGLVACQALRDGVEVDGVALWAVHARGRRLVRELRTFANMEASGSYTLADGEVESEAEPEGSLVTAGYLLAAETIADLEAASIDGLPARPGLPVLLLERDTMAVDPRLIAGFTEAGADVTVRPGPGYAAMMAEAHLSRQPREVYAELDAWLPASTAYSAAHVAGVAPTASDTLELTVDGVGLRETPLRFPHAFGAMAAIFTEPTGSDPDLCAILLNVGGQRRVGPNRMWVESARRWGTQGIATLRLDIAGVGDADVDGLEWSEQEDFSVYTPEFVVQVRAAMDALRERGFAGRFVLGGVCSGAYWAFQAALADERVAGAIIVNPNALLYTPWLETSRQARRAQKLSQGRIRARLRRRQVPTREVIRVLGALVLYPLLWLRQRFGSDPLDSVLDGLRDRDSKLLLVFTPHEQVYEELRREGRIQRLQRWPNVRVEELPGEGFAHTLQPLVLQHRVNDVLDHALLHEVARRPTAQPLQTQ